MQILRNNKIDSVTTRNQNLHGRKFSGAADAVALQDYVTLNQLKKSIAAIPTQKSIVGVTGSFTYVKTVNFGASTVTTGTVTVVGGIVTGIT